MSSWFGESLSNLKGQLQNFTKEVLSEADETEAADEAVSLRVKCEELQSVCDTQALEISGLRKQNNELQRRLQGDSKTAEEDDASSWWSVEQRWDASYFGGSSSSSSSAGGKQDRKGRDQHADEKDVQIRDLREKLAALERQRSEADGYKEENKRLLASVKELTERLQRDSEECLVLGDKLRDATAKVIELEGELQKVQKQFVDSLGDSQRRVVETEVEKLQAEKRRLSSGLEHAAESLGDAEQQEVIHGTLQALELENQVLKIRNAQLELAAKSSSKGGEAGWDTLDDHDSRGRGARPSDALTAADGTVPAQYEDDFDTLSVRSEVSEFSSQHRKQLEVQLAALQEEVERSEQLKESWANQKFELEEKLAEMQSKIQETEAREAEIRRQAAEDKRRLSLEAEAASKATRDLEAQLASLKEENVGLSSSLEELDSQHQGALDQLLSVKDGLARDNETLRTRMLELAAEEKAKETLDAAQLAEAVARAFEGLRWRKDTLERKVVELSRERAGMATELDSLRGVLPPIPEEGEAEAWLLVARDGMESLEGELERAKAALEALREDKRREDELRASLEAGGALEGLEAQVQELRGERESLRLELDRAGAAKAEAEEALEELRGRFGRLESVELELERARAAEMAREEALRGLGEKNAALEAELEDLRNDQERRKSLELELKQALTTKTQAEKVLEDLSEKNAALVAELEDLPEKNAALEAELEDLRNELGRQKSVELELKQALTTKTEAEKVLEGLSEKNAALEALVEDLRNEQELRKFLELELKRALTTKTEAENALEDLSEKNSALDAQAGDLLRRVQSLQLDLEGARASASEYEERLRGELDSLTLELAGERAAKGELQRALERLEEAEKESADVKEGLECLASHLERVVASLQLEAGDDGEKSPAALVQSRVGSLLLELDRVRAALEEKNSALEALSSRVESLEVELTAKLEAEKELKELLEASSGREERLRTEKRDVEEKLEALERESPGSELYRSLAEEKAALEASLEETARRVADLEEQSAMGKEAVARLSEVVRDKDAELERLRLERDELVRTVHVKHQESLRYHALLTQNLQQQQQEDADENKILSNEVQERAAKEAALQRELERLRQHMVSVEDAYTQETLRAEERAAQLLRRLADTEDRLKSSSTAHTSASILANQQVEALGEQAKVLAAQRDEARARLADAEDQALRQLVALRNLQTVLDKFRRDKDRDVLEETAKVRKQLDLAHERHSLLEADLAHVRDQLKEAKEGLKAAARLGQQLEAKDDLVRTLKARVTELEGEVREAKEETKEHLDGAGSKVDRDLVKNLLVGYFSAPPASRTPVLRVLADVLNLSATEGQQLGLGQAQGGSPPPPPSLSEAFVRFLESESQPQRQLRLLPPSTPPPQQQRRPSSAGPAAAATPSSSLLLSEVSLPQFSVARNTGAILKDVLKDS